MPIDALTLAEQFGATGRDHYEADGYVAPVFMLLDATGHGLVAGFPPGPDHPTDTIHKLCLITAKAILHPRFLCSVTEAWVKEFSMDDSPPTMQRGDLEKAHEALDPAVKTVIMTTIIDVDHPGRSRTQMSKNNGPDEQPDWEIEVFEGSMIGNLPEGMLDAYRKGRDVDSDPPDVGIDAWGTALIRLGLADTVMEM